MNRRNILTIIVIMTLSLIGVGAIQYYWVVKAVNLDEKNFNDKVTIALNNVKKKITTDTEKLMEQRYYENLGIPQPSVSLSPGVQPEIGTVGINQTDPATHDIKLKSGYLNQDELLENIDKDVLDSYLKAEMASKSIDIHYEYGVYSVEYNSYFIENGSYIATIGDTTKSSNIAALNPLAKAEYKIPLFDNESYSPGHLNIYFPNKKGFLWSNVLGILISSIIFTGLILFCFAYTIWVIVHQKKISEIKTDFINNMTHEFKTPIATISLASDSILSPVIIENKDKVKRFVGIIQQENKRMLKQVEKVLQMAQIDKENIELKFNQINIHDIIQDAAVNAELKVQSKGGKITASLLATDPIVEADGIHLASIVNNLLDNAEKYTPEHPDIYIETANIPGGLTFTVKDNGIGMNKDALKMIFEKFYRVHTGNLHDVKGFGLGLSYVKAMVEAHHGWVKAESELGKGSAFTIFIPKKQNA